MKVVTVAFVDKPSWSLVVTPEEAEVMFDLLIDVHEEEDLEDYVEITISELSGLDPKAFVDTRIKEMRELFEAGPSTETAVLTGDHL